MDAEPLNDLQALAQRLPLAMVVHDQDHNVVAWGGHAEHLLGWTAVETLGRPCPILRSTQGGAWLNLLKEARAGQAARGVDFTVTRRDGEAREVTVWVDVLRAAEGAVLGSLMLLAERGGPADAAAALLQSERKFRSYIEHALDAVVLTNDEGDILETNPAAARVLGFTAPDGTRRSFFETVDPSGGGMEVARRHFARVSSEGEATGEVPLRRADGTPFLSDISAVSLAPNRRLAFIRDVTAQRRADHELRLYAKVFETSGEAVLITDDRNQIVSVNGAFTAITGYSAPEVLGKNPRMLSSGRHDGNFYQRMWEALATHLHWQGEVWNRRKNGQVFPEWAHIHALTDTAGKITNYIAVFSDITEVKAHEARVSFMAHHDSLTGLPNRTLMFDRLNQALASARRERRQVAVLVIDLDGFKTVNDSLGHALGDAVLVEVAGRLKALIRGGDTVSRMGGDEFALVLPGLAHAEDVLPIVNKVVAAVGQPMVVNGQEIHTSPSVGISVSPSDGEDAQTLVRNADAAMYGAKDGGRGTYRFFTAAMNARAMDRLTLMQALRGATERGELRLHYQPQFNLETQQLVGAEALLRWDHPRLGSVPPSRFIPLAEEGGLIRALGAWVLKEACTQAHAWAQGPLGPVPVAVNLSPLQFMDADLFDTITGVLRQTGLSPSLLDLELTEGAVMRDAEGACGVLRHLRDLGVQISIDDFGTGYSSLNYLRRLPISRLKIDRSFVSELPTNTQDTEITRAIVSLGHHLSLRVLAEGVETAEQAHALRELHCDEVQGYLFGTPQPAAQLERVLLGRAR